MSLLAKLHRKKFLVKDGHWMAVIRPRDPEMALNLVTPLVGKKADEEFQDVITKQPYVFMGYAAAKPSPCGMFGVLDAKGNRIDWLREGDSLVTGEQFTPPECFA